MPRKNINCSHSLPQASDADGWQRTIFEIDAVTKCTVTASKSDYCWPPSS